MPSEDTALIDEASRRWPDFQGGRPIRLPDGQTWEFYEPEAAVRLGMPGWTFGADVASDVDAILSHRLGRILAKWGRAGDDEERAGALLEAAWFLLARNYSLTPAEFEDILAGASEWDAERQGQLGEALALVVGAACARSTAFAEAVG